VSLGNAFYLLIKEFGIVPQEIISSESLSTNDETVYKLVSRSVSSFID
jgi:hypothetical protein